MFGPGTGCQANRRAFPECCGSQRETFKETSVKRGCEPDLINGEKLFVHLERSKEIDLQQEEGVFSRPPFFKEVGQLTKTWKNAPKCIKV
jgi:hypothetical protein